MPSRLLSERIGGVMLLTISHPPSRNTLSAQVIAAGIEALGSAENDAAIRVVVLRGDGPHFCAGGFLPGLVQRRQEGRDSQRLMLDNLHEWIAAIRAFPKPVIAAVEGAAAGAGFSLALAADLIVAARDARFVLSHARLGLTPDGGATGALLQSLPRPMVQRIVWLGEPVSADALQSAGVIGWVVDTGMAVETSMSIAASLTAMAPNALACGKDLVEQGARRNFHDQLAAERDHFVETLFHPNGEEGLRAFLARRPPQFS